MHRRPAAALLCLTAAAACGGGTPSSGVAADAGMEAASAKDASPPALTVHVMKKGEPVRQARVIFHDATGAVIGEATTDNDGQATRSPAPSMVTVQGDIDAGVRLLTFVGVVDGDTLTVTGEAKAQSSSYIVVGSYDVRAPGPFPGATLYYASVGFCDVEAVTDPATPIHLLAVDACAGTGEAVLVGAVAGSSALAFAKKDGLVPTGSSTRSLDVQTGPWKPASSTTFEKYSGALSDGQYLSGSLAARIGTAIISLASLKYDGDDAPIAVDIPLGLADAFSTFATISTSLGDTSQVLKVAAAGPFAISADDALPLITATSMTPAGPSQFDVSWTAAGALGTTDGGVVLLNLGAGKSANAPSATWTLVVPPGATSVRTPMLPADLADYLGLPSVVRSVQFLDSDDLDGYAAYKRVPTVWTGESPFLLPSPTRIGARLRTVNHRN